MICLRQAPGELSGRMAVSCPRGRQWSVWGKAAVIFRMAVAIARGRWVIAEGGAVRDDAAACTATAASFHESGPWGDVCEWYPEATLLGGGYDRVPRISCSTGRYARVGCGGPQQRGEGPALLRTRSVDRKSAQDNDCATER